MQIIRQHTEAKHFILRNCRIWGALLDHSCGSGWFRVKPEVRSQLLCRLQTRRLNSLTRSITSPCSSRSRRNNLHRLHSDTYQERAANHAVAVDFQPVFGGLLYADCRLDVFIDCHRKLVIIVGNEAPTALAGLRPSTMVMTDLESRLKQDNPFQKQDNLSDDVDSFICMV